MANPSYTVRARWDEGSKSWWTDGEDIPGLCCQAASFDELVATVLELAPEIMLDNGLAAAGKANSSSRRKPGPMVMLVSNLPR